MADLTIVPDDVQNSTTGSTISADAGEAIDAGQAVYRMANGKFGLAEADGATPLYKVVGIALDSAGEDQPLTVCTKDADFVSGAADMVIGTTYCLSATAGGICPDVDVVNPSRKQIIGVATSATNMLLQITLSNAVIPEAGP